MSVVVGAVIIDLAASPRILAARRSRPADLAGLWEFPGGKVEPGESPTAALAREIDEELGAQVEVCAEVTRDGGSWPINDRLELRLYLATIAERTPMAGESHDELRWLALEELESVPWLPADAAALVSIRRAVSDQWRRR